MMADAVNNLTDMTSSVVTLVGFRLSEKPADDEHPFGHARIEYITGMLISFFVLFLGLQMAWSSLQRIWKPAEVSFSLLSIVIMVLSILIKLWLFFVYRKVGKHIRSETLLATATDSLNDTLSTAVVLLGAGIDLLFQVNLDGLMGLGVAVFILVSGVRLMMETANPLLGVAPSSELVVQICEKLKGYPGVLGIHDLQIHSYGAGNCFATVHCEVSEKADVQISHDMIDNMERDFLQEMNIHLVIHMDPIAVENELVQRLHQETTVLVQTLFPALTLHDFRVVEGITHTNLIFDVAVPFSEPEADGEIRRQIIEAVARHNESHRAVITVDRTTRIYMEYLK